MLPSGQLGIAGAFSLASVSICFFSHGKERIRYRLEFPTRKERAAEDQAAQYRK